MRVVDRIALAQGVEAVALAGMEPARMRERIEHRGIVAQLTVLTAELLQFMIDEADIVGRIVDDEFRAAYEGEKFLYHLGEARLVGQELARDAVHLARAGVDLAIGLEILMEAVLCEAAALRRFEARRLCVQHH